MGFHIKNLGKNQSVMLIIADFILFLGVFFVAKGFQSQEVAYSVFAALFMLVAFITLLVGLFTPGSGGQKPSNLFMGTLIGYGVISFLIMVLGFVEKDYEIIGIGNVIMFVSVIGINIAAFKPKDEKAFNVINLVATAVGLLLTSLGITKLEWITHHTAFVVCGTLLIVLASVSSSLFVYVG